MKNGYEGKMREGKRKGCKRKAKNLNQKFCRRGKKQSLNGQSTLPEMFP